MTPGSAFPTLPYGTRPKRPGPASTTWPSTSTRCRVCSRRTSSQGRSLEARHPRGLRREQGRSQEAPSCQERPVGHNLEPRSCQARAVGHSLEPRSCQARVVGCSHLQEAHSCPARAVEHNNLQKARSCQQARVEGSQVRPTRL
jgi:hypothetical protein